MSSQVAPDPIGETLHLLRLTGTLYCRAELSAPWGIEFPPMPDRLLFLVVTAGRCWLEMEGAEPRLLQQGSMVLLPQGTGHRVASASGGEALPLFSLPVDKVSDSYEILTHGGGGEITRATSVAVRFDHVAAKRLLALLPQVLQIDSWEQDADDWLNSTLRLIAREASTLRPGGETVITRLADILIVQALRAWLDSAPEANCGWLAALRDPQIGRALAAVHRAPERDWSLPEMASEAGMSRSAFAARFTALLGEPAMRYLTGWRLHLARMHLSESSEGLAQVALRFGYQSEAAFCRAFKQYFGMPPGQARIGVPVSMHAA